MRGGFGGAEQAPKATKVAEFFGRTGEGTGGDAEETEVFWNGGVPTHMLRMTMQSSDGGVVGWWCGGSKGKSSVGLGEQKGGFM